jgi:hypothetical protein
LRGLSEALRRKVAFYMTKAKLYGVLLDGCGTRWRRRFSSKLPPSRSRKNALCELFWHGFSTEWPS